MTAQNTKIFKFQALKLMDYDTWDLLANIRAAGSATFNFSPELAEQMSGPSFYPIETEVSTIATEASLNIGEYGSRLLKALMDTDNTDQAITTGLVTTPENLKGKSVVGSGSGLITALAKNSDATKMRSGFYRLKIKDITSFKVDVIAITSPDLTFSEYENFQEGLVKEVTMTAGGAIDLGIGVNATGAATLSGTGLADGDSALFRVYAPGAEAYEAKIGQLGQRIPKVKVACLSRTMSDGRWFELIADNAIFPGLNMPFSDEFAANEITGKLIFDPNVQRVARVYAYKKVS